MHIQSATSLILHARAPSQQILGFREMVSMGELDDRSVRSADSCRSQGSPAVAWAALLRYYWATAGAWAGMPAKLLGMGGHGIHIIVHGWAWVKAEHMGIWRLILNELPINVFESESA